MCAHLKLSRTLEIIHAGSTPFIPYHSLAEAGWLDVSAMSLSVSAKSSTWYSGGASLTEKDSKGTSAGFSSSSCEATSQSEGGSSSKLQGHVGDVFRDCRSLCFQTGCTVTVVLPLPFILCSLIVLFSEIASTPDRP